MLEARSQMKRSSFLAARDADDAGTTNVPGISVNAPRDVAGDFLRGHWWKTVQAHRAAFSHAHDGAKGVLLPTSAMISWKSMRNSLKKCFGRLLQGTHLFVRIVG